MWIPFVLLFLASPALLEASSRPAKRFYDTYNYYVIHHNPSHGHSPTECASALGAELVEQAGALRDHWLVRSAKQPDGLFGRPAAVAPSEDTVVASWHSLRRRSEPVSRSIRSLLPQIPRQRVKRSIPHPPNYDDVVSTLDIRDPIFSSQWHIINQEYPEFVCHSDLFHNIYLSSL
jgi:kexin